MSTRLDALLTRCGYGTRSEVKHMIRRGRVTVDGAVVTSAKTHVEPEQASVQVRGEQLQVPPSQLDLIMHKPVGHACSHDPDETPIIDDLLPATWRAAGVEPAGRLDRATSGLLLLSTDGQWLHRLIHPKRKVAKRYQVHFTGRLHRDAVRRCADGLRLLDDERPCRPAELVVHAQAEAGASGRATIILHEGRYHQVRRMFQTLGAQVVALHRDRVGGLDLPSDLAPGAVRPLRPDERIQATGSD